MKTLILLLMITSDGDPISMHFESRTDCEITRESIKRVMPYVSECLAVTLMRDGAAPAP